MSSSTPKSFQVDHDELCRIGRSAIAIGRDISALAGSVDPACAASGPQTGLASCAALAAAAPFWVAQFDLVGGDVQSFGETLTGNGLDYAGTEQQVTSSMYSMMYGQVR